MPRPRLDEPRYVESVRERLSGGGGRITVFAWFSVEADDSAVVERLRGTVSTAPDPSCCSR